MVTHVGIDPGRGQIVVFDESIRSAKKTYSSEIEKCKLLFVFRKINRNKWNHAKKGGLGIRNPGTIN